MLRLTIRFSRDNADHHLWNNNGTWWFHFTMRSLKGEDGVNTYVSNTGHTLDFKRKHGTVFVSHPSWKTNTAVKAGDVTLGKLEAAGQ